MTERADLAAEVAALQADVADLRAALQHTRAVAEHERQARAVAEERAAHAWRVVTTSPRRAERGATDR